METTYLLDTSNRYCYEYTTEELQIEVLGAIGIAPPEPNKIGGERAISLSKTLGFNDKDGAIMQVKFEDFVRVVKKLNKQ